ncbi:GyrI-like domain-containing protein [Niveibacterium sp. SC-1]|uniref:GyrI-like domain-containing protein n=1 Tax=Niveibacterium sp. SC-1 TaxID=3135646 RepID=UPI00311E001A
METRIEQLPAFDVVGYGVDSRMDEASRDIIPQFWQKYLGGAQRPALNALAEGGFPAVEYGVCCCFQPGSDAFRYVIGIRLPAGIKPPAGAETVQIPAGEYVVGLTDPASPDNFPMSIGQGWGELMGNWLPKSGYVTTGGPQFELYDERSDPDRAKLQIEIWIPIRKA